VLGVSVQRRVDITRRARRDLEALDGPQRAAIIAAITGFARGDVNVDLRKLQGVDPPVWRIRVGRYRVLFGLEPGVVVVQRVLDRRDAYR
jgi:mRNA-degrading endonuclease RelE of RelBE toxin-antitoxin system